MLCHIETEDGERFSDDDVVNHMIFLLMAAHDTSTITVSTMLQYLGQHPEWQQRCREEALALPEHPTLAELDGLVGDRPGHEGEPAARAARAGPGPQDRQGDRGPRRPHPGRPIVASWCTSRTTWTELWTDPERFDPERFADDRREDKVHRYAWEPFGGGVHKCIGMFFAGAEVKAILVHLLRQYEWTVDPATRAPMNNHSLPFPKDGQPVHLTRR